LGYLQKSEEASFVMKNFVRQHWPDLLLAFILSSVSLAVYNATLMPSLSYKSPDGNELATVPYVLGLVHSTGYPLYTWLGKLFTFLPIGDVAHRINLMSAVLGAAGVGLLYLVLMLATGKIHLANVELLTSIAGIRTRRVAAIFTALFFAFSLTFWSQTGIAEVYAPNVFMMTLTLLTLLLWARVEEKDRMQRSGQRGWRAFLPSARSLGLLFVFGLIYGLSPGAHMSNLGFAPAFALFILLVSWRTALSPVGIAVAGIGFLLGILQFLWLPYKATTLNDPLMLRDAPATLRGIYNYTLGAFPQFKFAFEWWQLPERIVLYENMLRQQYGLWGIALGLYGMAEMVWRRPKCFFLFVGMYLFHVWFFIQYRVFDLDVFFIPAHLIYAIFIGFGVSCLLGYLIRAWKQSVLRGSSRKWGWLAATGVLILLMALAVTQQVSANWELNDYSEDTTINDFYTNVWEVLPPDCVLLGRGGVFGYDMFYWRLVYNVRPDVLLPMLAGPRPNPAKMTGRPLYTNEPALSGGQRNPGQKGRTPWSPPGDMWPENAWYVPVLIGEESNVGPLPRGGHSLILYRVQAEPPQLTVAKVDPQHIVKQSLGPLTLLGFDLASDTVQPGGRLELRLYWRAKDLPREMVATNLGDSLLETHQLGLGNLERYLAEVQSNRNEVIVESYAVVVPATLTPGEYPLTVSLQRPWPLRVPGVATPGGESDQLTETLTLAKITILD
jgi:hypothetical protein